MNDLVFISYRRSDSLPATRGLAEQLQRYFGHGRVYMDVASMHPGVHWPERLERALEHCVVLLAVIGPDWLTASDHYGRRRLDIESDWTRREIEFALQRGIPTIPVLIGGAELPPERDALPRPLQGLLDKQALDIPDSSWTGQVQALQKRLEKDHGFTSNETKTEMPTPMVDIEPLPASQLDGELESMAGWEIVESQIPGDYPESRVELRKVFRFPDFVGAMQFMQSAIDYIEEANPYPHHPRWENVWRTVTVWLTTWDIEHKISKLDLDLAKELDRLFREQ